MRRTSQIYLSNALASAPHQGWQAASPSVSTKLLCIPTAVEELLVIVTGMVTQTTTT